MKHPMRTLLYDLLVVPLLQPLQRLLDLMVPPRRIGAEERVPVPGCPLPRRADVDGPVPQPREPEW